MADFPKPVDKSVRKHPVRAGKFPGLTVEKEFDPIPRQKSLRSVKEYQDEILDVFAEKDAKTGELALRQTP